MTNTGTPDCVPPATRGRTGSAESVAAGKVAIPSGSIPIAFGNFRRRPTQTIARSQLCGDCLDSRSGPARRGISCHHDARDAGDLHQIDLADIVRADDETDPGYAKRQYLPPELWSIPDSD